MRGQKEIQPRQIMSRNVKDTAAERKGKWRLLTLRRGKAADVFLFEAAVAYI